VDQPDAGIRLISNTELSAVRRYAFGGGGSGAINTDTSARAAYDGVPADGIRGETMCSRVLTAVVTPQLDIASQQRVSVGVEQSVAAFAASRVENGVADTCVVDCSTP
jgi:hypothetical protein